MWAWLQGARTGAEVEEKCLTKMFQILEVWRLS
jgi:hypothetical protein